MKRSGLRGGAAFVFAKINSKREYEKKTEKESYHVFDEATAIAIDFGDEK